MFHMIAEMKPGATERQKAARIEYLRQREVLKRLRSDTYGLPTHNTPPENVRDGKAICCP